MPESTTTSDPSSKTKTETQQQSTPADSSENLATKIGEYYENEDKDKITAQYNH